MAELNLWVLLQQSQLIYITSCSICTTVRRRKLALHEETSELSHEM